MLLTMPSARLPCSAIFSRLPVSIATISSTSARSSSASPAIAGAAVSFSSSSNSTERPAKLLTKFKRVLDLVGDAGGQLAERGHLLRLDQPVLGAAQISECGLGGGMRAARLLAARRQFLEQPRILDREHRLPGKGLQQGRDGRREAAGRAPADHQPADDLVLAQQRHRQNRMDAFQQSPAVGAGECGILLHVVDMHRRSLDRGAAEMRLAQPDPPFAQRRHPLGTHAKGGFGHKDFLGLVEFVDRAFIGLRELRRAADDRGEHGVEIERGIDRAQHFFERLQFGDRAGQLVGALPAIRRAAARSRSR